MGYVGTHEAEPHRRNVHLGLGAETAEGKNQAEARVYRQHLGCEHDADQEAEICYTKPALEARRHDRAANSGELNEEADDDDLAGRHVQRTAGIENGSVGRRVETV